ncbi:thioesterase family protein [Rhizomicrobium electricum]|jgi:acyl-CoA thioesterase FadM|uniref:Thioesterase family protein n=1 Tax=Rhizomicrobium electricum TaxID=480070 RepID=A0ABN1ELQ6_9PROT|nr:thioesterase family protein [Rhizomicrobium electricum]NIJ47020.1 acyl-CoA thioesterase FadM [Rhizomicrobium electricum]
MTAAVRMLGTALAAPFRPRLGLLGESRLAFHVLPNDLDYNVHMNNARYLALMDVGRVDLILRTGLWRAMWHHHWQAVIAGCIVRYRRPLRPFQRMELVSRLIGWDERWFYIEHRIAAGAVLACQSMIRGAFLGSEGMVAPAEMADALGEAAVTPQLPGWIAAWREADRGFGVPARQLEPEEA